MKKVFIYALCEPGTETIRYVGKTDNLKRRLSAHLSQSIKHNSHLGHWLRGLKISGEAPTLVVLCEVGVDSWMTAESEFILSARSRGFDLVNGTVGGEGGYTGNSGTGAKISASRIGKPRSLETRLQISLSLKGHKATEITKDKQSRARKAHLYTNGVSRNTREKLSRAVAAFWSRNNISNDNW